jgi:peptidoglycan hydrolase-like protein with peptidoglycan-binding domain
MGMVRRKTAGRALGVAAAAIIGVAVASTVPAAAAPAHVTAFSHASSAATYVPPKRTLKLGMKGADVKALQERLAQLKYDPGPADGTFGDDTLEAVWAFQEVQGLSVDGLVGPKTGHALVDPRTYKAHDPKGGKLRVEVNLGMRVLVLYNDNKIELISHVSSGGGYSFCNPNGTCSVAITPTGHFHTTVFMPGWVQVPLGEMYNPVFFISTVFAIHGDTDVPVDPVSHGCVRIPMFIAAFFHNLVKTPGTSVFIYN